MSDGIKRPGGRTKRTSDAVFDAVIAILAIDGFAGLTVEAISANSGIHKTTIYRRWGSSDNAFAEVVATLAERSVPLTMSGDTRTDLLGLGRAVVTNLESPVGRAIASATLGRPDDDEFVVLVREFWEKRMSDAAAILSKSEGHSDGLAKDPSGVVEEIVAQLWFRVLVRRVSVTDDDLAQIVDRALKLRSVT